MASTVGHMALKVGQVAGKSAGRLARSASSAADKVGQMADKSADKLARSASSAAGKVGQMAEEAGIVDGVKERQAKVESMRDRVV